jgi:hypothetical protein
MALFARAQWQCRLHRQLAPPALRSR